MDFGQVLAPCLAAIVGGGGVGGVWAWLAVRTKARTDAPAALVNAAAAFQGVLSHEAERLLKSLSDQVEGQARRNDVLEKRIQVLEGENVQCRGENSQLQQDLASLKRELIAAGIPIPVRPPAGSWTVIEDGRTTTMIPNNGE